MKYRYIGTSGLLVSRICLGTMNFGMKDLGCDRETSLQIIRHFIEAGGNFIDTADIYNGGLSEEIVGEALQQFNRDELVLATKVYFPTGKSPNARGLSRKHIIEACEASLRRLKTDYIDLYQIHGPDTRTNWEETMMALGDLVQQGKVRYLGCCNLYAWQIMKANAIGRALHRPPFVCAQHMYNMVIRDVEREILPACVDQGMGFICWSPLASGFLSGKYKKADRPEEGTRIAARANLDIPRYWHDRGFRIADALCQEAKLLGKTPAQVALAWLLYDRRVTSTIVGPRKLEHIADNLVVGEWDLPVESRERLEQATEFQLGYPEIWLRLDKSHNIAEF
jgi:aryl-alcohol dehydrogenase-like predicted oxidoreductase